MLGGRNCVNTISYSIDTMFIFDYNLLEVLLVMLDNEERLRLVSTCHISNYLPYHYNREALAFSFKFAGKLTAYVRLSRLIPKQLLPKRALLETDAAFLKRCNELVCKIMLDKNHEWPDNSPIYCIVRANWARGYLLNVAKVIGMMPMLAEVAKTFYDREPTPPDSPHSPSFSSD